MRDSTYRCRDQCHDPFVEECFLFDHFAQVIFAWKQHSRIRV
jgi:hypothetical protein